MEDTIESLRAEIERLKAAVIWNGSDVKIRCSEECSESPKNWSRHTHSKSGHLLTCPVAILLGSD